MIFILGYYERQNFGDDQYKITLPIGLIEKNIIQETDVYTFYNIDSPELKEENKISTSDKLILGGGDVLDKYFLDKLEELFTLHQLTDIKVTCFSVGIPYLDSIDHPFMKFIDAIYLRTWQDIPLLKRLFPEMIIEYLEDTSKYLAEFDNPDPITKEYCLINFNAYVDYDPLWELAVYELATQYYLIFIPFSTLPKNNDHLHHLKVFKALPSHLRKKCFLVHHWDNDDFYRIIDLINSCKIALVMRFHAMLISHHFNCKVGCIASTRKTVNWYLDHVASGDTDRIFVSKNVSEIQNFLLE